MSETRYYANVADISQIPQALLTLVMHDWFDKRDVVSYGNKVDSGYIRIIGDGTDQIQARAEVLKGQRGARNGGGVRIWEVDS